VDNGIKCGLQGAKRVRQCHVQGADASVVPRLRNEARPSRLSGHRK
jgi:hypothetical protein